MTTYERAMNLGPFGRFDCAVFAERPAGDIRARIKIFTPMGLCYQSEWVYSDVNTSRWVVQLRTSAAPPVGTSFIHSICGSPWQYWMQGEGQVRIGYTWYGGTLGFENNAKMWLADPWTVGSAPSHP